MRLVVCVLACRFGYLFRFWWSVGLPALGCLLVLLRFAVLPVALVLGF